LWEFDERGDTSAVRFALSVILVALSAAPSFAEKIKEIIVEENTKTTDATVALIADVEVGDEWSPEMTDEIKRLLEGSGLFKQADVFWDSAKGQLHLVVRDKHSWVIAPAFYNQPTNVGGGVGFGENNLFGENKKLLLYGQVATGDSFFIGAYVDPSINGTRFHWQGDVFLKTGRIFEYTSPSEFAEDPKEVRKSRLNYLNVGAKVGMSVFRVFSLDFRGRAAKVTYSDVELADGATIEQVTGDPASDPMNVPAPGKEGWDVSGSMSLSLDTRANWRGVTSGNKYEVTVESSAPSLGSDFDYQAIYVNYQRARRVLDRHNLILKSSFAYGRNLPFQQEMQTGGTAMRGYKNSQFRGNIKGQLNLEYSVPVFSISGFSMRGLAFWDSAYTTFTKANNTDLSDRYYLPGAEARGLDPFKNSVGGGVRFYLQQIVLPLLGVDIGYGLERGEYEIYLAIGLTD
jgi:outer membrane protein insertion porin family